ncbi:MAG: glycosyltransferase [Actinobacteria bacterium]|uniref:Unannotated protein n=1 Tax=freshwater metagenome TaxID=449393 RepID=A0A6J7GHN8_9ZZZZ|nr:glycosyltransferase [Actinomycetota bacterium]
MRIGFDARYIRWDEHDGISRFSVGLVSELANLVSNEGGDELVIFVSDERQLALLPAVPHFMVSAPTSAREPWVAKQINRAECDIVFSPMQTMGSRGRTYKLILTVHDLIYYRHRTPPRQFSLPVRLLWRLYHLSWWPQRYLLNRADAVVTVSEVTARLIQKRRLTRHPVFVVPNAADAPSDSRPQPWRSRGKRALYMGSFMPYKNVDTLARAAAVKTDWEFHLLSKCDSHTQDRLRLLAGGGHLIFHDGTPEKQYRDLLSTSLALITASRDEGFGIPLIEAMSQGTPLVVSDIDIFHEVAGEAAVFVSPDDPQGFAQALGELAGESYWSRASSAGLERSRAYSWEQSARLLFDVLKQTVHARSVR